MSYILDALKRSEQERHQEKVATIGNDMMVIPRSSKQRPIWPYLLLAALLVNAGALIYFTLRDSASESESQARPDSSLIDNDSGVIFEEQTSTASAPRMKAIPDHLRKPVAAQQRIIDHSPNVLLVTGSAGKTERHAEFTEYGEEIIRPKQGVERRKPGFPVDQSTIQPQEDSSKATLSSIKTEEKVTENIAEPPYGPALAEIKPASSEDDFSHIPLLSEMALGFQRNIPSIQFSSHIYSTEPSARRAMINNLYLREGDGFSGLVLQTIGEFYVVLEKQGEIFRIPVLRDWQAP